MIVIGIDPGLSGAVVACDDAGGHILEWFDCPTIPLGKGTRREFDEKEMAHLLFEMYRFGDECVAFIETQQAYPKQGVSSSFQTGVGFGAWRGILAAHGIRHELVHPKTWQRAVLPGGAADTKARSLLFASRQWPALPLTKPNGRKAVMDGRSDAACIALYGVRRMRGEG